MTRAKPPFHGGEILLSLASVVFVLALLEIYFRLAAPQIQDHNEMFRYDASLGWTFVADKTGSILYPGESANYIRTNAHGFRDRPFPAPDSPVRKIFVAGDSFVSNISVPDDGVFTEILERTLERTSVMNLGVNGYGQVQELMVLQRMLREYSPDLVVLVIYLRNDLDDNVGPTWISSYARPLATLTEDGSAIEFRPSHGTPPERSWLWRFARRFHVLQFLRRRFLEITEQLTARDAGDAAPGAPPELRLCSKSPSAEVERMYRIEELLLLRFADTCGAKGVPILFVLAPSLVQVDHNLWNRAMHLADADASNYDPSAPNRRLLAFAARRGLSMLDLLPALKAEAERGRRLYNPRLHWTREGNEVVARALAEHLRGRAHL